MESFGGVIIKPARCHRGRVSENESGDALYGVAIGEPVLHCERDN